MYMHVYVAPTLLNSIKRATLIMPWGQHEWCVKCYSRSQPCHLSGGSEGAVTHGDQPGQSFHVGRRGGPIPHGLIPFIMILMRFIEDGGAERSALINMGVNKRSGSLAPASRTRKNK